MFVATKHDIANHRDAQFRHLYMSPLTQIWRNILHCWLWALCFFMIGSIHVSAQSKRPSYICAEGLKPTTVRKVSCRKIWKACPQGSIVWHPSCVSKCDSTYLAKCQDLRRKQKAKCPVDPSSTSSSQSCPEQAKQWRERCGTLAKNAEQVCQKQANIQICRDKFDVMREQCETSTKKREQSCRTAHQQRVRICESLIAAERTKYDKICKQHFEICLHECKPVNWPCRKNCFASRHKCLKDSPAKHRDCRHIAARLHSECLIKNAKQQHICIHKAETKMYRCMRQIQIKHTVCSIKVGKRYDHCVAKSSDLQLQCWFRQMDQEYLCSGQAHNDCLQTMKPKFTICRQACTTCQVATPHN